MKPGRISIYILLFFMAMTLYEITFQPFPKFHKSWWMVAQRMFYYFSFYGILAMVSKFGYSKTDYSPDKFSLQTLYIYSWGKFIFYFLIVNYDMPTYIDICNSKPVAISFSILLWGLSVAIWYKRFKIKKLIKNKFHGHRKI